MTDEGGPRIGRGRAGHPIREAVVLVGLGLAVVAAGVWWFNRAPTLERSRIAARSGWAREPDGAFIGSRACRECHPGESALYPGSGHAQTLHLAADLPLARRLDGRSVADPEAPGVTWSYALRDGDFLVERRDDRATDRFVVDYAFGSGRHATTFLTITAPEASLAREHRLTHFGATDSVALTPGQRAAAHTPGTTHLGRDLTAMETYKCFHCHTTRISAAGEGFEAKEMIPNVTCESCHGPARRHVADARAGLPDLRMPHGSEGSTAEAQLALCGQCHRHPSRAAPGLIRPDNTALARFQPVGISESKCYKKGGGRMSCVTCHDPHARVSSDRPGYEKACLGCHESPRDVGCPVSPRGGCIDCHMPRVDSGQAVLFTDHWIRIRDESRRPGPSSPSRQVP